MSAQESTSEDMRELYRELILDHARSPRHFGKLEAHTHYAQGINPLCGDKLKLYFNVDELQTITESSFEGSGCAISVASASLLTEQVTGLKVSEAEKIAESVTSSLSGVSRDDAPDLGKLRALEGVREYPSRVKCATLAWRAMQAALSNVDKPATTE